MARWWKSSALATLLLLAFASPATTDEPEALWGLLRGGGQVVVMRHATTDPGVGDPPGFRIDDCATQRNLSESGREEARRVGGAFRVRGVPIRRVLSSRWCRCLETARLAFGTAESWPPLDSFFGDRSREPEQTKAVQQLVGERPGTGNLILVTHQVNIRALTGLFPAPGEMIILTPQGNGAFRVAGRLAPAALSAN
jgi:broad specificity phosphatase PhoE